MVKFMKSNKILVSRDVLDKLFTALGATINPYIALTVLGNSIRFFISAIDFEAIANNLSIMDETGCDVPLTGKVDFKQLKSIIKSFPKAKDVAIQIIDDTLVVSSDTPFPTKIAATQIPTPDQKDLGDTLNFITLPEIVVKKMVGICNIIYWKDEIRQALNAVLFEFGRDSPRIASLIRQQPNKRKPKCKQPNQVSSRPNLLCP